MPPEDITDKLEARQSHAFKQTLYDGQYPHIQKCVHIAKAGLLRQVALLTALAQALLCLPDASEATLENCLSIVNRMSMQYKACWPKQRHAGRA